MKNKNKKLLDKIEIIDSSEDIFMKFNYVFNKMSVKIITFLNHHAVNLASKDDQFYNLLLNSDILYRDGIGIKIACMVNKIKPGLNMNGTDFIPMLLDRYRKIRKETAHLYCEQNLRNFKDIISPTFLLKYPELLD